MDLIYIGKVVNTHGIKGEIRIISDFKFKENAFKVGNKLLINNDEVIISNYRKHKCYDMITLVGINDINDVLKYKNESVYINRKDLVYDGYLDQDIIGLSVYDKEKYMGKVIDIYKTKANDILVIENKKRHMVPYIDEFVKNIDIENKRIEIEYIEGLCNED